MSTGLYDRAAEAAKVIRDRLGEFPRVAVVLGSGLGEFADGLGDRQTLSYGEIPHLPAPTVVGHRGNLVVGTLGSARVSAWQGRFHPYEGHDLSTVTFPVRVMQALGVRTLILTAATGGVNPSLRPGDLVCLVAGPCEWGEIPWPKYRRTVWNWGVVPMNK